MTPSDVKATLSFSDAAEHELPIDKGTTPEVTASAALSADRKFT